jgi:hypothetical protein
MTSPRDTKSPASVLQRLRNVCVQAQSVQNAQLLFVLERWDPGSGLWRKGPSGAV